MGRDLVVSIKNPGHPTLTYYISRNTNVRISARESQLENNYFFKTISENNLLIKGQTFYISEIKYKCAGLMYICLYVLH